MEIFIFTLFPEYFSSQFEASILGRAQAKTPSSQGKKPKIDITVIDIRKYAQGPHSRTDDRPFGGGPGMVMMVEPIHQALKEHGFAKGKAKEKIVLTSAKGATFTQQQAQTWADDIERLAIVCGHYEGVDERVAAHVVDEEIRIGNYVLTGGEPAAAVMVDAITRLLPGVLGNTASNQGESHEKPGKMGIAQYTRPEEYHGWKVPEVLLSGDHQKIETWREKSRSK